MKLKAYRFCLFLLVIATSFPMFNYQDAFAEASAILLQDDFNDNSIDTAKWTEVDDNDILFERNNQLEIRMAGDTASLTSTASVSTGKYTMQAFLSVSPTGQFNRVSLFDNDNQLEIALGDGSTNTFYVIGSSDTGITGGKDVKIEYDYDTSDANFYYWNGTAWVNMGTFNQAQITPIKMQIAGISPDPVESTAMVDNAFFTKGFYTTHFPNQRCLTEILQRDDFNDNSLDTDIWTLSDPTGAFNETNNQAEFFLDTVNEPEIFLTSVASISPSVGDKFTMQAFLSNSSSSTGSNIAVGDNGSQIELRLNFATNTFSVTPTGDTGITGSKDVKVEFEFDSLPQTWDVNYFYWNGTTWVNMGSDLDDTITFSKMQITSAFGGTENITAIADDTFFTEGFYTTHYPDEVVCGITEFVYVKNGNSDSINKYDINGVFNSTTFTSGSNNGLGSDSDGNIYSVSRDGGSSPPFLPIIEKYNSTGGLVLQVFNSSIAETPTDIAIDSNGNMYITDTDPHNRIVKYNSTGGIVLQWGQSGSESGNFTFSGSQDSITIDGIDNIYVKDQTNRIQKFDRNGNFITSWTGIITGATYINTDNSNNVYNLLTTTVTKYNLNGTLLNTFTFTPVPSYDAGFADPAGIAISSNNLVYVGQADSDSIRTDTVGVFNQTDSSQQFRFGGITLPQDVEITSTLVEFPPAPAPAPAPEPAEPTGGGSLTYAEQLHNEFDQAVQDEISSIQTTMQSPLESIVSTLFEFQVLDTSTTDLQLQSFLQNQKLGIRWSNGDDIVIVSATPANSPFLFTFEQFPITKRGSGSFVSENFIEYDVQVPRNLCSPIATQNCVEMIRYDIPITVNAIINKTQVSDTGSIIVDLTQEAIDPIMIILVTTTGIAIVGMILHKSAGGNLAIPVRRVIG